MDRPTEAVSTRVLLWGVVAPLLVGSIVPPLAAVAMIWLICGLLTLMLQAAGGAFRRVDPGEDDETADLHEELGATLPAPVVAGRWWNRPDEDPNTAAARAGSWG